MTIKQYEKAHKDMPIFEVVVQEPGKCFRYSCFNKNEQQRSDIENRKVYDSTTINGRHIVYCW